MSLRPYQAEGYRDIFSSWDADGCPIMFMLATGGGKTVTFVDVIKKFVLEGKRVILCAHREELITQAWNTLYRNRIYSGIIKGDHPTDYSLPVQVCSIQTISRRSNLPPADVIIIDEAHHATHGNSYGKLINRYSSALILIVTATPYRLSGEGFKRLHPYKETKLIINRTLRELTNEGWLVPLKYFVASIPDLSEVHMNRGDYNEDEAKKAMEMAPLVDSYFEHAKGKTGVCYAINVAHSISIVQKFLYAGVPSEHIDANTPDEERKRILSDIRCGFVKLVSNVGIWTEGVDIPNLDFSMLARPTKSLSMFLQMVGRITRPEDGLVDRYLTIAERQAAIAKSSKPFGIVLDNAGLWLDHGLPDMDRDWEGYFNGKRPKPVSGEEMEMLIFVAEDESGRVFRTTKAHEVEGLKLIEVTTGIRQKIINLTSLKEFDKHYYMFKNMPSVKKPGYSAFERYVEYCRKQNFLMVPEIWDYLHEILVKRIRDKVDELAELRSKNIDVYPPTVYGKEVNRIKARGVSDTWLKDQRKKYEVENKDQLEKYELNKIAV